MYKTITIALLFRLFSLPVSAQNDTIESINKVVSRINKDTTLALSEFDANEIYNQAFDGGGIIHILSDESGIRKMIQQIGVSFGRLTTIVYFDNGEAIKIEESEENFKWREDDTGWDYSELNVVFKVEIYILDWEEVRHKTFKEGKRVLSDGSCALSEYEPFIEMCKKLAH